MGDIKAASPSPSAISEGKKPSAVTRGHRLLKRRLKMGMTQQELCECSGIDSSHISRLENGDRIGSFEVWRKLADALGTTLARLTADG